jgi:hypothetical protein
MVDSEQGGAECAPEDDSLVRAVACFSETEVTRSEPARVGERLGEFEIVARVGAGGMGVVYHAEDRSLQRRVALKVVTAGAATHAHRARRFAAEIAALATLDHPAIVRYVAHGATQAGEPFLAMEWLEGEDLGRRLRRGGITLRESVALGVRVAGALGAAHARGILHRDIKPSNIFLRGGDPGQATVLDFGLARVDGAARSTLTPSGATVGTPGYMAPEQARGEAPVDARADVFSLGCVLFECLTGERAFGGAHPMGTLARVLFDQPIRVRDRSPEVPEALSDLVGRMLAKRREDRPRNGDEVCRALLALDDLPEAAPTEAPRDSLRRAALTSSEQQAVAIVLIGAPRCGGPDEAEEPGVDEALGLEARRHDGHLERLVDGSRAVLLARSTLATDLAARAARCALALRAHAPRSPIALALGQGQVTNRLATGLAIDRAEQLLAATPADTLEPEATHVTLDELAAGLLDARFDVRERERGLLLCGEREIAEGTRTLLGEATPCVGRDREIRTLEHLLGECLKERTAQAVLVTAPAGAGKSRLLYELLRHGEPVAIWVGRGDSLGAGTAFGMLASPSGARSGSRTASRSRCRGRSSATSSRPSARHAP